MENELNLENQEDLINANLYLKLDFPTQNIKGNNKFKEFKNRRLNELGKDAKLFHCKKDNIYFYVEKAICQNLPYYYQRCPLCRNYICYFCERNRNKAICEYGNCCIALHLYYLLFYGAFKKYEADYEIKRYNRFILLGLLPFTGFFNLYLVSINTFFFELLLKEKNTKNTFWLINDTYSNYFISLNSLDFITLIIFLTGFINSISCFIYYLYMNIFILFISLFTKFKPLKYYIGFILFGITTVQC